MILECGGCAKMYRVRDDASPHPTKCPTCGGDLRATGGPTPANSPSRVKELETRIQSLERELAETRTSRPSLSVETSPGFSGFSAPVEELRSTAEKADRLERELLSLRSDMELQGKQKDQAIAQARELADRESAERRKQEARASGLEETHARALEGKDKTIQALDASIASYRGKVEGIQKKLDAVEIQRLNDLNAFDTRIREREQSDRATIDATAGAQQQALTELRAQVERDISEKDRLISEGRQNLDREAGERRRLTETLNRLQENADRAVAEKDTAISAQQATLASYKSKIGTLQSRVDSLEQMRRSEHDQISKQVRNTSAIRGRVDEASHLAVDLDHSLDSIEASIATLRDRARRLKDTLQETSTAGEALTELAPLASSLAPAPEPEVESAPPALSQADWAPPAAVPAPLHEEQPAYSEVERTKVKPRPEDELTEAEAELFEEPPAPAPTPEPEPELLSSEPVGRLEEPSGVMPIVPAETEPAPAPVAEAPAAEASDEASDDIPLISPPEEEKSEAAPTPPGKKPDEAPRKKFSWQRK